MTGLVHGGETFFIGFGVDELERVGGGHAGVEHLVGSVVKQER
jgi:hypothetical protein